MTPGQQLAARALGWPDEQLAAAGRHGDTEIAHVAPGEVVVPDRVLDQGDTRRKLSLGFAAANLPMGRYTVGGDDDSINPATGMREYYADPGMDGPSGPDSGMGGMEGSAGMGEGYGSGPGGFGTGAAADVGMDDMDGGPVGTGFDPDQHAAAQAAVDAFNENSDAGREAARTAAAAAQIGSLKSAGWSDQEIGDMLGVAPDRIGAAHVDLLAPDRRPARSMLEAVRTGRPPSSYAVARMATMGTPISPAIALGDMLTNMAVQRGWDLSYDVPEAPDDAGGGDWQQYAPLEGVAPKNGLAPENVEDLQRYYRRTWRGYLPENS